MAIENTAGEGKVQFGIRDNDRSIFSDPLYPSTKREQQAFNRSIANKTSGLKRGTRKSIIVFTADKVYHIDANDYMSGRIIGVENLNDEDAYEFGKEYMNGTNEETEVSDGLLQSIRNGKGRGGRSLSTTEDRSPARRDVGVDEEPYYRKPRRSLKERLADEGLDISETADSARSQNQLCSSDLSNTDVLVQAAEAVKSGDEQYARFTDGERDALNILRNSSI